ncbi:MAG TPA: hypothetical protein VK572_11515 [Burkholderiales bacterium]|nr:hypothetical protein [Burkholderiales bacterium]
MKSLIVFGCMVTVLLASFPAFAQPAHGGRGAARGPGRPTPPQQVPARDTTQVRDARMTPEQRQQLRRDVHDHGRDIYRDRSGPGPNRP